MWALTHTHACTWVTHKMNQVTSSWLPKTNIVQSLASALDHLMAVNSSASSPSNHVQPMTYPEMALWPLCAWRKCLGGSKYCQACTPNIRIPTEGIYLVGGLWLGKPWLDSSYSFKFWRPLHMSQFLWISSLFSTLLLTPGKLQMLASEGELTGLRTAVYLL
jgi:hypothetical protein